MQNLFNQNWFTEDSHVRELATGLMRRVQEGGEYSVTKNEHEFTPLIANAMPGLEAMLSEDPKEITEGYLKRWFIYIPDERGEGQMCFLHEMFSADTGGMPHDHSWDCVSLPVRGGHREVYATSGEEWHLNNSTNEIPEGSLVYRPYTHTHILAPLQSNPTISVVATTENKHEWNFYGFRKGSVYAEDGNDMLRRLSMKTNADKVQDW